VGKGKKLMRGARADRLFNTPVRPVLTTEERDRLDAAVADPTQVRGFTAPLPGAVRTADQERLVQCGEAYQRAAEKHPRIKTAVAAMIGIRRMYAVAYAELLAQVEAADPKLALPAGFADFCVQYAAYQASKPFDEHELMRGVTETVLPWVGAVVDRHVNEERSAAMADQAARNEARRVEPIPLGFRHCVGQELTAQPRDKTLVLVGWKNAVLWLLDQVGSKVPGVLVRLNSGQDGEISATTVCVPPQRWAKCATSDRTLDGMVDREIAPVVGGPVDLVVCDDLAAAITTAFLGRPAAADAGDAHRRLRKWCDVMGAGFVAGLPTLAPGAPDVSGPEFEQLRTFTHLRPVVVVPAPAEGYYRVTVGGVGTFDVPRADLDDRARSLLT